MRTYKSVVRNLILFTVLVILPVFLSGKIGAVGADCSDGCDDYIPLYGQESYCQYGTYCCTGGGCPSINCTTAGYSAKICGGYWTCCATSDTNCTLCNTPTSYAETWGTCDPCGTDDGGGGGSTTTYGTVIGRVVSDLNFDGGISTSEMWANNASTCAGLKSDALNFVYDSGNILKEWSCNPGAYYRTNGIVTGSGRSLQLTGVPTSLGYDCSRTRWEYSNTTNTSYNRTGTGCTASDLTITANETQHLWFFMTPNRPPIVSLSSPLNYVGSTSYKLKPSVTERESGGALNIRISSSVGTVNPYTEALWINAYGTPASGVYPLVRVYGWNKSTGVRTYISQFTVTGASQGYLVWVPSGGNYGFFDIEFANDAGNATEDRNLFLGQVEFIDYTWWPGAYYYTVTPSIASEAALIQLDRGDFDDGYDVIAPPITAGGYVGMYWSGSVRYPFMWYSPNAPLFGNITLTATDIYGASTTRTIQLNPLFRQLSGYLWTMDYSSLSGLNCAPNASSKLVNYSGANVIATYDPDPTTNIPPQGSVSSTGDYLIQNVFGSIHEACLTGMNTTTSPYYRLVCANDSELSGMGMCSGFSDSNVGVNTVLNLGLQPIEAKRWITAYNGNISAAEIELRLPPLPPIRTPSINPTSTCGLTTYCSLLTNLNFTHYVLGYPGTFLQNVNPVSYIFTEDSVEDVGSSLSYITQSGVSATGLGEDFRKGYGEYLTSNLKIMIDEIVYAYKNGLLDGSNYTSLPTSLPTEYVENSINLYEGVSIDNYTYSVQNNGVAFLVVPKKNDLVLKINEISATGSGRIIIITDREVEMGEEVEGQVSNVTLSNTSPAPLVKASIITTDDLYIKKYITDPTVSGTLVLEGPVISGGDVYVQRNFPSVENEKRPAMLVKYNTFYVSALNNLVVNDAVPKYLKPLFDFSLTSKEL